MHVYPHYGFQLSRCSNLAIAGTAGEGYALFNSQATEPTTPAAGSVKLFSDSTVSNIARLSMKTSSGSVLTFFRDGADTVRNNSGGAFTKGQVVYKNGANGTTATIALAKANSVATAGAVGLILATTLANNSFGTILTRGRFQGLNTVAFSEGDTLYVDPTTAGAVTNVRPVLPNFAIKIGTVVTSNASGIVDLTFQPYVPPNVLDAFTVATLPAGAAGMRAYVTDATAPTYNGALVGGGVVVVPVFHNGVAWISA